MTKRLIAAALPLLLLVNASPAENIAGPCELVYSPRGREVSKHVDFGSVVKAACDFKLQDFGGSRAIIANGKFVNTGDKQMGFAYYVAFFDKDGHLVGCASFDYSNKNSAMAPGKKTQTGSCIIRIPEQVGASVASYQVAFYEIDQGEVEKGVEEKKTPNKE